MPTVDGYTGAFVCSALIFLVLMLIVWVPSFPYESASVQLQADKTVPKGTAIGSQPGYWWGVGVGMSGMTTLLCGLAWHELKKNES